MKYHTYKLSCDRSLRFTRKAKVISKKLKGLKAIQASQSLIYHQRPDMFHTMDFHIHCDELHWLNNGRKVYFYEDVAQPLSLMNSTYNITSMSTFFEKDETFILTLPKELDIDPLTPTGILVCCTPSIDSRMTHFTTPFLDFLGSRINPDISGRDAQMITLNFQTLGEPNAYCSVHLDDELAIDCLQGSWEDYKDKSMKKETRASHDYIGGVDFTEQENVMRFKLMRYVLTFLIYRRALPERIRDGLPNGVNTKEVGTPNVTNQNSQVISAPQGGEASPHYRRGHFRQLNHERFYRNEHKDLTKGSRVIFISDAYIGRKVDPKVIT